VDAERCVLVYSKPARPGTVKTRLIGELTPEQAAELHNAFLWDLVERLSCEEFDLWIAWALDEGEPQPEVPGPGIPQRGHDLGERLLNGLADLQRSYPFVAAVGSDHPELPKNRVTSAFDLLQAGNDVVLGPALDGGYYLVAVSRSALEPRLFSDIEWSTEGVLETTIERCRELDYKYALLPAGDDVDRPDDLLRLQNTLVHEPSLCPRSRELLHSWGRLGE